MKKKSHGYYCRICQQYKANEKFSGRGHAAHICKACAKRGNKPPEIEPEPLAPVFIGGDVTDEYGLFPPIEDIDSIVFAAAVEQPKSEKKKRKPSKEKLLRAAQKKQAKVLLSGLLANGEISLKAIHQAANKAGIPHEALRRAKGSLKISSTYTGNGSVWRLPSHKTQAIRAEEDTTNGENEADKKEHHAEKTV